MIRERLNPGHAVINGYNNFNFFVMRIIPSIGWLNINNCNWTPLNLNEINVLKFGVLHHSVSKYQSPNVQYLCAKDWIHGEPWHYDIIMTNNVKDHGMTFLELLSQLTIFKCHLALYSVFCWQLESCEEKNCWMFYQ